jgi:two-component system chemotaxis response regulator CheB
LITLSSLNKCDGEITLWTGKTENVQNLQNKPKNDIINRKIIKYLVAIGVSTGGPRALQQVIPLMPRDVPAAFLIVQHMPPGFTKSLADRLNSMGDLLVKEAEDAEIIKPGYGYVAPGDYHMMFDTQQGSDIRIKLSRSPAVGGHRPSVDVMMSSLSDTGFDNIIGVIMTGMGKDGSEGIRKIKHKNNGYIIAQDEKSCVVYGMPKAAVQTGLVDLVVPLKSIAKEILRVMGV